MATERRKSPRISTFLPASIICSGKPNLKSWGTILDVSIGGIALETRLPLEKEQKIYVSFKFGDNFEFRNIAATVKRVSQRESYYRAGLELDKQVDKRHLVNAITNYFESGLG